MQIICGNPVSRIERTCVLCALTTSLPIVKTEDRVIMYPQLSVNVSKTRTQNFSLKIYIENFLTFLKDI